MLLKKALASVLAAASCLYMSAGFTPCGYVLADEAVPEVSQEEKEETPETKGKAKDSGSKETEKPVKKTPETEPSKEPGKNEPEKKETEPVEKEPSKESSVEKEPEKPSETTEETTVETTKETQPETPSETASETTTETPAETSSETSVSPSEKPSEDPEDNPEETTETAPEENPTEETTEQPAEDPSDENSQIPAENSSEEEINYTLSGKGYLQTYKTKNGTFADGILTIGKRGKRIETFSINLKNSTGYAGSLTYRAYVKKKGWTKWAAAGKTVGYKKKKLNIEAIQIKLTGELAKHYSVEYKTAISSFSDRQGWVRDGALAGTMYNSKRVEEIQVRLVPVEKNTTSTITYRLRGQTYGWQNLWSRDGHAAGTFSKYIDAISINLGPSKYFGGITYRAHILGGKWTGWNSNGAVCGYKKKGKKLEALQIKLTGDMAEHYDIYYRVYVQSLGWLEWAMNGQTCGSTGAYRRIEKIQIILRDKGTGKPGEVEGIVSVKPHPYYAPSNTNAIMTYKNILDAGYADPDAFRKKLIKNFEYMDGVGYFHMGKMVQGYTDCAGSVSLAFRVALGTAKFTKKYKKGTLSNGKQLYGIGVNYCGIKSYKDKYGWCRNGTASVNSHFLNTIIKNRKIKYSHVSLSDRNDGVHGWSNAEWIDYLNAAGAKPGDVFVWFNHDWSKTKGQHMTMYAGIGDDGIAYEWTASSTYGVILSPLTDRTPQNIFESFTLFKGVADLVGYY